MKLVIIIAAAAATLINPAPSSARSYPGLSRLGEPAVSVDARTLALGGASAASARGVQGIFYNPAALGLLPRRALMLGLGADYSAESVPDEKNYASSSFYSLPGAGIAYPAGRLNFGAGYRRLYDMGYSHSRKIFTGGNPDTVSIEASGGVKSTVLGAGFRIMEDIYAGLSLNLAGGSAESDLVSSEFQSSRNETEYIRDFSGSFFKLGALYSFRRELLLAGITWSPGYTLKEEWSYTEKDYLWGSGAWATPDKVSLEGVRDIRMPSELSAGLQYNFPGLDRTILTADITRVNWSGLRYREKKLVSDPDYGKSVNPGYRDVTRFSAGAEHYVTFRTALRAGFSYEPFYGDNAVDSAAFTAGAGFEISRSLFLDIGGLLGMRTYYGDNPFTDDEQTVSESYIRLMAAVEWHF